MRWTVLKCTPARSLSSHADAILPKMIHYPCKSLQKHLPKTRPNAIHPFSWPIRGSQGNVLILEYFYADRQGLTGKDSVGILYNFFAVLSGGFDYHIDIKRFFLLAT